VKTTNNSTALTIFDYQLIREGIIELININKISEGTALDLLDKVREVYDSSKAAK
jgi:hypothetical protein